MELKDPKLFRQLAYINGKWQSAQSGETFPVRSPITGDVLGNVPLMNEKDTQQAIDAAAVTLRSFSSLTGKERSQMLKRWAQLLLANIDDLAQILTLEEGKPITESRMEIGLSANFLEWFAEEAKRTYGDVIPATMANQRLIVIKQPIGVVGAITPFNFPSSAVIRKCGAALAAGCTIIVKPSESCPFSALALAELAERAGIPPGALNIITGNPESIGNELTSNFKVRKIAFTGSTRVGKLLMEKSAATVKKITLELGGHAPFIIFKDAKIDAALIGLRIIKFINSGQTCLCANRIFIEQDVYDDFKNKLVRMAQSMKLGNSLDPDTQQGPLINMAAVEKIESQIQDAVSKGATIACGGKRHALGGTFFEPTVLCDVNPEMKITQEETFGPIAPLIPFRTEEEAIQMANNTRYGLGAYFYTQDIDRAFRVAEQLEFGMIGVNCGMIVNEAAPFGGVKESGIGREGSKYGLDEYLEIKYICINENKPPQGGKR